MATADSLVNDPEPPPAAAKQPARVVQLSRRVMGVVSGGKSARAARLQKRPAPALPPEAKRAGERPQELNAYAAGKARGAATNYMDLVSQLGELRALGEKGTKQLLAQVLPRLAQHELPPAALVPQLLQLAAATEDRRLLRLAYYLLQLVLGPGCAGTPAPAAGEATPAVVSLPGDISARAWSGVLAPETSLPLADAQLRALSAAVRAADGGARLDRLLGEATAAGLERAQALVGAGGTGGGKARQREALEAWELHWACLLAARNALPGKALGRFALRSSLGIASPCAAGARHALALLTHAMQQNAAAVFKEDRDLPAWVAGAAAALAAGEAGERQGKGGGGGRRPLMRDRWARLELARLCVAAVYADWTSTQAFVQGVGEPFWRALVLLASRPEEEDLVALEAVACLFGSARGPGQEARGAKLRARAWLLVSSEAGGADGLAAAVAARLTRALGAGGSEPLRVTACAAAGAVLEAAARGGGRGGRGKEPAAMATLVRDVTAAVKAAALGSGSGPALRCAALEALLWTQAGSSAPVVPPAAVAHCIAAQRWPRGLLQALLDRIYVVLRAAPAAVRPLLQLAGAAATAGAAAVEPDQLLELWSAAMRLPDGKAAALSAALALLASPAPARPQRPGALAAAAAAAAGDDAGRLLLLRDAAWWLGEHANLAAGEFAGSLPPREERHENAAPGARATPLESAALDAFRNPRMAAVVSHLAHAALTLPPGPRAAAVQALAKVAVRSEEPFRLQCYSVLAALADAPRGAAEPDAHGVSCAVQPALGILDALYSSRLVLERLARAYGRQPHRWPPAVAAQLRARNTLLEQRVQRVVCSLSGASYFLLGPLSRDVLTSGVEALAPEPLPTLQTAVSASTPEAPLSPLAATGGRHSRASSMRSDAGTPLFGGPDPLAALTDNLGQHLARQAFSRRAPAPWELAPAPAPIPEEGAPPEPPAPAAASWEAEEEPEARPQPMQERGVVVHAFRAEMSDELSVGTGEEVAVEAELDGWFHCANRYGVRGLVPASYVRLLRPGEAVPDAAAQLFGGGYGGGASLHQREQSLDLLNQPDMLSALLGSPPEQDDGWGAAPAAFHARRLSSLGGGGDSYGAYDDPEPAAAGVDGGMAIPEPAPELPAADNPFDDAAFGEEPPPATSEEAGASDDPFTADEPASGASSNPFERAGPEPAAATDNPFAEAAPPLPPLVRAPPPGGAADGQPVSARVDLRSEGSEPGSALRRSADFSGPLASSPAATVSPALSRAPTPGEPLSRRHSRQASFAEGGLSLPRQASHLRQASGESAGAWAASRASSMELSAIRGTVLYEFVAEADDELSVAPGDAIVIQAEVDGWFQVLRPADGKRGLIPASYASATQQQ